MGAALFAFVHHGEPKKATDKAKNVCKKVKKDGFAALTN